MLKKIQDERGVLPKVGDTIQLAGFTGSSYTLRAAKLSAVYEYAVHNDLQDKIVLISPSLLRPLIGLNSTEIDPRLFTRENSGLLESLEEDGIDSLFGESEDFEEDSDFTQEAAQAQEPAAALESDSETLNEETVWNYIVCSAKPGVSAKRAVKLLNREFAKREWTCQAVDWRAAAGMAAQYIYWMRLIFNIGLIVIIATGFIIVNNTLVIAALKGNRSLAGNRSGAALCGLGIPCRNFNPYNCGRRFGLHFGRDRKFILVQRLDSFWQHVFDTAFWRRHLAGRRSFF